MTSKRNSLLPLFKEKKASPQEKAPERRLARLSFISNRVRNEFIAFCGEFAGTFMFLFLAFSATQVANASAPQTESTQESNSLTQSPNTSNLLYIALAFGFSLAINVWAFFRISGGLFNPCLTLGLLLISAISPLRALIVLLAQLLAAITSAGVVSALFPGPLNVATTLNSSTSIAQGLFIEMFLTADLVFVVFMLAAEKHKATFLAPLGIGLALFVCELCGVYFTGGSLNPARSFGPAVVNGEFPGYHWIYWLGPTMGTILAWAFFKLMKFAEYETANPGQDFNELEEGAFEKPGDAVTSAEVERPHPLAVVESSAGGSGGGAILSTVRSGASQRPRSAEPATVLVAPDGTKKSVEQERG
ncbi:aquaporin-like protein [Aulographum hederae CBS 113979]|uniref:Aquaporin-like protein n=1 Tax=Aulographum hederae CBS 113979 TaxID=1176131 RepID=A0A6G1HB33_9PEZI|nr:aquaporin-like protein [Aulographum hederae CBS 113979]